MYNPDNNIDFGSWLKKNLDFLKTIYNKGVSNENSQNKSQHFKKKIIWILSRPIFCWDTLYILFWLFLYK